jgi:thioredoxin reductase
MELDESRQVYVIGGGPAGLAAAAELRRRGMHPVILERGERVGTSWRAGYDRLHLHTVRALSGLPGLGIPREAGRWPSRDAVIDYLERYRSAHELDVLGRTEVVRVEAAAPEDGDGTVTPVAAVTGFEGDKVLLADGSAIAAQAVIAATGYRRGLEGLAGHLGVLSESGMPRLHGGPPAAPGLFFVGYTVSLRGMLRDIAADARRVARALERDYQPGRADPGA